MNPLKSILNQLDLIENKAVFFRDKEEGEVFNGFSSDINKKLEDIKPDAFYVFNNQPFILFFDLTSNTDLEKENEIHKKVWSFDNSPIIFVIKNAEIKIYNALNFEKHKGLEEIELSEKERNKKFSFWNLQSGEAFEWFYEKHKKTVLKKRVNQQLFENIKRTIIILKDNFGLEESLAKILVLRLIFIRYLIDRKIKIDTSFIHGSKDDLISRRKSLSELIANPKQLVDFFDYLNKRFNGVLFKDSNIELNFDQANLLSKLFNPDGVSAEDKRNLFSDFDFQFDVFDFGIIPVELISGIYETLLDEETKNATSAVYTPPFLVDYILTQTVDNFFEENESTSECKIFDPAMGSGIFLVQGLRRMIEREKELYPNDDNLTFGNKIRTIAERNLFGIDINEEAINVACFSIYVALLDYQEPGNIDVYKFPNLKDKNFFKAHFFDLTKEDIWNNLKNENINFILGNPPWRNNDTPEHLDWLKNTRFDEIVSDKQIAQSYLIRVKDFVRDESKVALIVTSKVYYNDKAQKLKKFFLENNYITEIFDLSPVRNIVFENAKNPGAIIFFRVNINKKEENSQSIIKHISLKQNRFFNKYSKTLVIEKFDRKQIKQLHFIENKWMFKVALYGNTLDFLLLKRFKENKSLDKFLDNNSIINGNGIKKGTPKNYFDFLIGLPIIQTSQIQENYTFIRENFPKLNKHDVYLEAGRELSLFKGKKIILGKRTKFETHLNISVIEDDCVYTDSVNSITFNFNNETYISEIFGILKSKFSTYFQYLTSANWGVYYPEINKSEYLSFPFFEPSGIQKNKLISLVDNLLQPYKEFYKEYPEGIFQGDPSEKIIDKINSIVEEIYQITGYEKDLIDYVLNVSRYQFQESKQHLVSNFNNDDHRNEKSVLKRYAEVYIQEFEKIYDDEYLQVEIYSLDYFIAMNFVFLNEKPNEKIIYPEKKDEKQVLNSLANSLSIHQITDAKNSEQNLFIQKDIKGFEKNSFYIIKPTEYKCWHRAMAWYDVAEFKEAIQKAELERLNSDHNA
ncbi:DNA methyltransferase [Flavobacterium sp. FZUC8N2.13]|uniref:site-specific DNA-methyltransferase (adenine-specific) n=1 Tax=Flavobacterium zubiriense TaxID=3138075 RepID=A0ABV4TIF7_9FLAO